MDINFIILLLFFWHYTGSLIIAYKAIFSRINGGCGRVVNIARGFEFMDPSFVRLHMNTGWIKSVAIAVFFMVLLPIPALCYWLYRLCSIRRC